MKTHLDYIIKGTPKYPICVPSHQRPVGHTFEHLKKSKLSAYIYIDVTDDKEEYEKTGNIIVQGPKRNIAEKRYDMIKHQQELGTKFAWFIDDDYIKFQTKDLDSKYIPVDIASFFATIEQYIDVEKDWFVKIPSSQIGLKLFGPNKSYKGTTPLSKSSHTLFAGCYGINIELMKQHNINFDKDCPLGVGEDVELVCRFIKSGFSGKTVNFLEAVYDKKIKSQAWDLNVEQTKKAEQSKKHKDVYRYLIKKYPNIIHWDLNGVMGAKISAKNAVKYPEWYIKEYPDEYKQLNGFKFGGL